MVNEIERVFSIVDALETKKAQHIAQRKTLEAERSTIALDAFAGNDKARKRLDSINASIATQASELAADAAIAKANERVTALRQEQAQAQARGSARNPQAGHCSHHAGTDSRPRQRRRPAQRARVVCWAHFYASGDHTIASGGCDQGSVSVVIPSRCSIRASRRSINSILLNCRGAARGADVSNVAGSLYRRVLRRWCRRDRLHARLAGRRRPPHLQVFAAVGDLGGWMPASRSTRSTSSRHGLRLTT
jgi:hypothetical protein